MLFSFFNTTSGHGIEILWCVICNQFGSGGMEVGQVVVGCPCPGIAPGLECSGECVARRFDWLGRRSVLVCVCVVRRLWNLRRESVRRDPSLPFGNSLALVTRLTADYVGGLALPVCTLLLWLRSPFPTACVGMRVCHTTDRLPGFVKSDLPRPSQTSRAQTSRPLGPSALQVNLWTPVPHLTRMDWEAVWGQHFARSSQAISSYLRICQ